MEVFILLVFLAALMWPQSEREKQQQADRSAELQMKWEPRHWSDAKNWPEDDEGEAA